MEPLKIHENLDDLDGVFHADTGEKWVRRCSFKMSFRKKKTLKLLNIFISRLGHTLMILKLFLFEYS